MIIRPRTMTPNSADQHARERPAAPGMDGGLVLIAPDKFKGSLSAAQAARHLTAGLSQVSRHYRLRQIPVADGYQHHPVRARGPLGADVASAIAVKGQTAVIELADVVGLQRISGMPLRPLEATSYGVGQLIRAALDLQCRRTLLAVGGSACTDAGAGMLQALGARFLDTHGAELPPGGGALQHLAAIDPSRLDLRIHAVTLVLATDVNNPLLGPDGAAAIYGAQKGASPQQVRLLENALARFASITEATLRIQAATRPGAGAAGFDAIAFLAAAPSPGIGVVLDLVGFHQVLPAARLVITGEGSLDHQTLHGKAPIGIAHAARSIGVPTVAVAGHHTCQPENSEQPGSPPPIPCSLSTPASSMHRQRRPAARTTRQDHRCRLACQRQEHPR